MGNELRTSLAPFLGQRVKVRGIFDNFRNDAKGVRGCIKSPEIDGQEVASHIWVTNVSWTEEHLGSDVEFTAVVTRYTDADGPSYGLKNPDKLTVLNTPLALKIPEARIDAKADAPSSLAARSLMSPSTLLPDPVALVVRVTQLAEDAGGWGQLQTLVAVLAKGR